MLSSGLFHLQDLDKAASELSRVLKPDGSFLISTANPEAYAYWEGMFDKDATITEKKIDGKVNIPVQSLSRNIVFKHTIEEIRNSLERAGLQITNQFDFGGKEKFGNHGLFINFEGTK